MWGCGSFCLLSVHNNALASHDTHTHTHTHTHTTSVVKTLSAKACGEEAAAGRERGIAATSTSLVSAFMAALGERVLQVWVSVRRPPPPQPLPPRCPCTSRRKAETGLGFGIDDSCAQQPCSCHVVKIRRRLCRSSCRRLLSVGLRLGNVSVFAFVCVCVCVRQIGENVRTHTLRYLLSYTAGCHTCSCSQRWQML